MPAIAAIRGCLERHHARSVSAVARVEISPFSGSRKHAAAAAGRGQSAACRFTESSDTIGSARRHRGLALCRHSRQMDMATNSSAAVQIDGRMDRYEAMRENPSAPISSGTHG